MVNRIWVIEGNRKDNGNHLYYHVQAQSPEQAQEYLLRTDLKDIPVQFTTSSELVNGRYEDTINCKVEHPDRYAAYEREQGYNYW